MTEDKMPMLVGLHRVGVEELQKRWARFVALGVMLIVLGFIALGYTAATTIATVVFIGWLMIIGGVAQAFHAFTCKAWGGFFIDLLIGILNAVVGFMVVAHPGATAVALTLIIVLLLIFGGLFRIAVALSMPLQNRSWIFLNGLINLLLGVSIWHDWPVSGLWVIGMFLGIEMLFNGWSLVMLGLAAKKLPKV